MADEPISIEIKLVSGEDLRAFNFFQKLSIFAIASISTDDPKNKAKVKTQAQAQRTQTDRDNDAFPEWNHEMRFSLDSDSDSDLDGLFLHFDLRHEGVIFGIGDRTIGEVRIPIKDIADEASSGGVLRYVRYQVRTSDGKPNGVLNLSYRFNSRRRELRSEGLYPKVEEVDGLDLIRDSNLSHYSPRLQVDRLWPYPPPQTASYLCPNAYPQPHWLVPHASPGFGERHGGW